MRDFGRLGILEGRSCHSRCLRIAGRDGVNLSLECNAVGSTTAKVSHRTSIIMTVIKAHRCLFSLSFAIRLYGRGSMKGLESFRRRVEGSIREVSLGSQLSTLDIYVFDIGKLT